MRPRNRSSGDQLFAIGPCRKKNVRPVGIDTGCDLQLGEVGHRRDPEQITLGAIGAHDWEQLEAKHDPVRVLQAGDPSIGKLTTNEPTVVLIATSEISTAA